MKRNQISWNLLFLSNQVPTVKHFSLRGSRGKFNHFYVLTTNLSSSRVPKNMRYTNFFASYKCPWEGRYKKNQSASNEFFTYLKDNLFFLKCQVFKLFSKSLVFGTPCIMLLIYLTTCIKLWISLLKYYPPAIGNISSLKLKKFTCDRSSVSRLQHQHWSSLDNCRNPGLRHINTLTWIPCPFLGGQRSFIFQIVSLITQFGMLTKFSEIYAQNIFRK